MACMAGQRQPARAPRATPGRRHAALLLLAAATTGSATVIGTSLADAPRPILHEYVPSHDQRKRSRWAREGRLPDQIKLGDRTLPRPAGPTKAQRSERVLGADIDRATTVSPDRTTTHDGVLSYTAEFNPSVVPFKRMAALDRVDRRFRLKVSDPRPRPVPLARRPTPPDRTAFWGSLVLRLRKGVTAPIPSVAAEARIVSYSASPPTVVQFYRDSADNISVSANADGQLRLVFLTDAPRRYFAAEIPPLVTAADVPPGRRPVLPPSVQRAADRVLRHVGVRPDATLRRQLDRLVPYFRNFEATALARDSGNTYLDIALSQRGVCRHRSWAFVITVQALGVPARYVQNEAHAFTEVFLPRLGWIRIDLGGASSELRVANARDKAVHDPGPDPFPRPSRFARTSYSQLQGGSGIRDSQRLRQAPAPRDLSRLRRVARRTAAGGTGGTGTGGRRAVDDANAPAGPTTSGTPRDPAAPPGVDRQPRQLATRISVRCNDAAAQRGDTVRVWGRVAGGGAQQRGCGSRSTSAATASSPRRCSEQRSPTIGAASTSSSPCRATSWWATTASTPPPRATLDTPPASASSSQATGPSWTRRAASTPSSSGPSGAWSSSVAARPGRRIVSRSAWRNIRCRSKRSRKNRLIGPWP